MSIGVIETGRLRIRAFTLDDWSDVNAYTSDADVMREGHFRKCIYRRDSTWWDEYFYALLEEEWFKAKAETAKGAASYHP
ncbi:MAG TPA: hypothetical protein VLA19_22385 [Herpetosiphonaceae bacterium]|nr:hypothetical protein [Herpetosiphonaceae bacterium]